MSEGMSTKVADRPDERGAVVKATQSSWHLEITEIIEALLLSIVTIATAWSGYQAAEWSGRNALYYGQASKERMLATRQSTTSGQQLLYNANTFNGWGAATTEGNSRLAAFYAKRFTADYHVAFLAWLRTDPAHNPKAPPGPAFMPHYHNPAAARATRLDNQATATFLRGTAARDTGNKYVRVTVLLATILFLVAISQRFKVNRVRRTTLGVALVLLAFGVVTLTTYPIA